MLVSGSDLYIYTGAGLIKADAAKNLTTVAKGLDGRANGIVKVSEREFILTNWSGFAYYINADGSSQELLNTSPQRIAAGINYYDPKSKTMYMTTDEHNTVVAFRVK